MTAGGEVAMVFLSALGMTEGRAVDRHGALLGPTDPTRRILDALADREALLVVDNCEHLLGPVAELVEEILRSCPAVRVLATSREPLAMTGEALWPLSPLRTPAAAVLPSAVDPATAAEYPAVRLFCDRARAARPAFVLDETTVGDVTEIVRRLDGLPLAIELAAARFRTLPLPNITAGLSDRFRLLTGSRTALPRHRTLRAVVEWSWDLLSDPERRLAEAVSVFAAGVTAASAHAACPELDSEADAGELLGSLVDKSLLTLAPGAVPRYRMLETLREFGIERLSTQGRLGAAHDAHARFFAGLAARAEPQLRTSGQLPWIRALVEERENLAAAIRHLGSSGDAATAVTTVARLGWFWLMADWHTDFDAAMAVALDAADARSAHRGRTGDPSPASGAPDPLELLCLRGLFIVNASAVSRSDDPDTADWTRGDLGRVAAELNTALAQRQPVGDWPRSLAVVTATVLTAFADPSARTPGRFDGVLSDPIPWVAAVGHIIAAVLAENDGEIAVLGDEARLAVAALRPLGERWALHGALRLVAQACVYTGDLPGAVAGYTEALQHSRELAAEFGTTGDRVFVELELAGVLYRLGEVEAALAHARAATRSSSAVDPRAIAGDAVLLQILQAAGAVEEAREVRVRISRRLAERVPAAGPFATHETALVLAIAASIALDDGDLDRAAVQLGGALAAAVETTDQPVIAAVGVGIARLLHARGEPAPAARAVGAAALLRGAADETDPVLARLLGELRAALGRDTVEELTTLTGDRAAAVEVLTAALGSFGGAPGGLSGGAAV